MCHLTTLCQNKHFITKVTELKQSFADFGTFGPIWTMLHERVRIPEAVSNCVPFGTIWCGFRREVFQMGPFRRSLCTIWYPFGPHGQTGNSFGQMPILP